MSPAEAAAGMDRLPWLRDEPRAETVRRGVGPQLPIAVSGALVIASGVFWLGARHIEAQLAPAARTAGPTTTVRLPAARPAPKDSDVAATSDVTPDLVPEVRPVTGRELRIALPTPKQPLDQAKAGNAAAPRHVDEPAAAAAAAAPAQKLRPPQPVKSRVAAGPPGRAVEAGAFGSVAQAEHGWQFVVRAYPGMAHLPVAIRAARNSKGLSFYRVRVTTTSQAHSEVLCQRMQQIRFSCEVAATPSKPQVER